MAYKRVRCPERLSRMADDAPWQGYGGWVLDPPLDAGHVHPPSSWSELRDEVERKLDVGAAWGAVPHSSSRQLASDRSAWKEEPESSAHEDFREIPPDPETTALVALSSAAVDILHGPSSPYKAPQWVEDFQSDRRRLELAGRQGAETLDEWWRQGEARVAALLGRKPWSLLHILGILRRLPNDRFFLGEKEEESGPSSFDPYHADVAERAALKYARWDGGGVEINAWKPGLVGLAQDKPGIDAERLAEIFALVRLAGTQLAHVERLRRAVVRGTTVVLRPDSVADSRPGPELRRRLDLYAERTRRFSFLGETAGTFRLSDVNDLEAGEKAAARVTRTTYREDEGGDWWRYETSRRLIRKRDKRFVFSVEDLGPAHEYMKLLEDEVIVQYGLSPEAIVAILSALGRMVAARFVAPDGTPEGFIPERLAFLDRRGYLLVHEDTMDNVVLGRWAAEAYSRMFPDAPVSEDLDRFVDGFKRAACLDSYRKEDLSLQDGKPWVRCAGRDDPVPMPPPFIYPAGDYRLVDLNAVGGFVQGLVDCLVMEEATRQRVSATLERRLGAYFRRELRHPLAFEPSKKLYVKPPGQNRRLLTDLDVSVRVGSVLVAIDAKAIQVSPGYRRYVHADLRNRWQKFEQNVQHGDEQAYKLARQPKGTNYDLVADGYTHVVTLLCSTVPEFIDTDDENFYIRDDVPRVATPPELRNFLAEATEENLKALPFAKRIRRE